ncbi:MAG: 3-hydroxybutyryl-CoA dehydrogenase, partial [uncultured Cytophagales bacterium]
DTKDWATPSTPPARCWSTWCRPVTWAPSRASAFTSGRKTAKTCRWPRVSPGCS